MLSIAAELPSYQITGQHERGAPPHTLPLATSRSPDSAAVIAPVRSRPQLAWALPASARTGPARPRRIESCGWMKSKRDDVPPRKAA